MTGNRPLELLLRYFTYGRHAFNSAWVRFDLFLVVISGLELIVSLMESLRELSEQFVGGGLIGVFKIFRIAKLLRPLRVIPSFRPAWKLVRGILDTASIVLYAFILIMITT